MSRPASPSQGVTTASAARASWWSGARGEWFVVVQILLMGLVFLGPRRIGGWPEAALPLSNVCAVVGPLFMIAGGALFTAGLVRLGRSLTPLPYPKDGAPLVRTGPYSIVRHPIYSGGLLLALGWALRVQSWLTLGYAAALFVLLDLKSRREERWLLDRFPEYAGYRRRVRKLLPFVY